MYCVLCACTKKSLKSPQNALKEHVNLKISWWSAPRPPSHNSFCGAPLCVFALGLPNPLGGPEQSSDAHTEWLPGVQATEAFSIPSVQYIEGIVRAGGCLVAVAQWQSTGSSCQGCPGFDCR